MNVFVTVEEVSHVAAEDGEHSVVAVLAHEPHEVNPHLVEELMLGHAQHLDITSHCQT